MSTPATPTPPTTERPGLFKFFCFFKEKGGSQRANLLAGKPLAQIGGHSFAVAAFFMAEKIGRAHV